MANLSADPQRNRVITAVRLGSEPMQVSAMQGARDGGFRLAKGIAISLLSGLERGPSTDLRISRSARQKRATAYDAY